MKPFIGNYTIYVNALTRYVRVSCSIIYSGKCVLPLLITELLSVVSTADISKAVAIPYDSSITFRASSNHVTKFSWSCSCSSTENNTFYGLNAIYEDSSGILTDVSIAINCY